MLSYHRVRELPNGRDSSRTPICKNHVHACDTTAKSANDLGRPAESIFSELNPAEDSSHTMDSTSAGGLCPHFQSVSTSEPNAPSTPRPLGTKSVKMWPILLI